MAPKALKKLSDNALEAVLGVCGVAYDAPHPALKDSAARLEHRKAFIDTLSAEAADRVMDVLWDIECAAHDLYLDAILTEAGPDRDALAARIAGKPYRDQAAILFCQAQQAFRAGLARGHHIWALHKATLHSAFLTGKMPREDFLALDWQGCFAPVVKAMKNTTGRFWLETMPIAPLAPSDGDMALLVLYIEAAPQRIPVLDGGRITRKPRARLFALTALYDSASRRLEIGGGRRRAGLQREVAKAVAFQISGTTGEPVALDRERADPRRALDPNPFPTCPRDGIVEIRVVRADIAYPDNPLQIISKESTGRNPTCLRQDLFDEGLRRYSILTVHEIGLYILSAGTQKKPRVTRIKIDKNGYISVLRPNADSLFILRTCLRKWDFYLCATIIR